MTAENTDPYRVLGVSASASDAEIRSAFRALAKKYHPDMNPGDKAAEDSFKRINQAYDIIGDAEKRKQFDSGQIGADGAARAPNFGAGGFPGGGFPGGGAFRWSNGGRNPSFDADDLSSVFSEMFGGHGGHHRPHGPVPGEDARYRLSVTLEDIAKGETRRVVLSDGQTLDVAIPVGIEEGKVLRLRGKGRPSPNGGPAGDALVEVTIEPHARFTRNDYDLSTDLPVTLADAVLGNKVSVQTLTGQIMVTVPKGSSSGATLRLKGQGIRTPNRAGDLYAKIMIVLPERPDPELEAWVKDWAERRPYSPKGR